MSGVLETIVRRKREEIVALDPAPPRAFAPRPGVAERLRRPPGAPLRLLAEHKRRSPSAGVLSTALGPGERALAYGRAGAALVSVLCDGAFFDGAFDHLGAARRALTEAGLDTPLLAKEFVVDPRQVVHAAASGADAVLLVVRIVDDRVLGELVAASRAEGLEPFVEVADEAELERALQNGARIVGVNARDLDTLAMDASRAARVLARIPDDVVAVHLSGIGSADDVRRVASGRADAALIGEALMRVDDPTPLLAAMVDAARVS